MIFFYSHPLDNCAWRFATPPGIINMLYALQLFYSRQFYGNRQKKNKQRRKVECGEGLTDSLMDYILFVSVENENSANDAANGYNSHEKLQPKCNEKERIAKSVK